MRFWEGEVLPNTELAGSPEAGSRLITEHDLDRAALDVRLSLESMLSRLPFDDSSYMDTRRDVGHKRRVQREMMAPMSERKESAMGRADALGSVSARSHTGCGGSLRDYWTSKTWVAAGSGPPRVVDKPELLTKCDRCLRIGIGVEDEPA